MQLKKDSIKKNGSDSGIGLCLGADSSNESAFAGDADDGCSLCDFSVIVRFCRQLEKNLKKKAGYRKTREL